jgi:ABC-2 type transport system permease protein
MSGTAAILKKELFGYFTSAAAYIAVAFFVLASGAGFFIFNGFFTSDSSSLRPFFTLLPVISILFVPSVTMGSWAAEVHSGTAELLYTLPLREGQLVAGKFFAAFILFALSLLLTLPVPLFVSRFGYVDFGALFAACFGILCFSAASLGVGQLISLLTRNQIAAFIASSCALILFNTGHLLPVLLPMPYPLAVFCNQLSFAWHFDAASKGIIDSRDILFFGAVTTVSLYGASRILVMRKWG